jgi:hypothetical protein
MANKKKTDVIEVVVVPTEPKLELAIPEGQVDPTVASLTNKAYSLAYVPKKGHTLFEVSFNPETGEARVTKTDSYGTDRVMAKERFKLAVVKAHIL